MDPRTLLILQKMLQRQLLKEIHGCISTGKEANVYHAITESGDHRAIKGKVLNQQIFMALQSGMRLFRWSFRRKRTPLCLNKAVVNKYLSRKANSFSTLKVYKTSILVFKDRAKYMMGEFRWQKYCKGVMNSAVYRE